MPKSSLAGTAMAVLALLVLSTESAHAYIDPGTGSFVLQTLVAGFLAAAFVVKAKWRSIRQGIGRLFARTPKDEH